MKTKTAVLLQSDQPYRPSPTEHKYAVGHDVAHLNRQATAHKNSGNWPAALACLWQARQTAAAQNQAQSITELLRLPLFLQQAGLFEAAKYELNYLLDNMAAFIKLETKGLRCPRFQTAFYKEVYKEALYSKAALIFKREKDKETAAFFKALAEAHQEKRIAANQALQAALREDTAKRRAKYL